MKRRNLLIAALAASPVAVTLADESGNAYPSRKVRLLLAAAAGGNPDVLVRLLADKLAHMLGQPFFVDNMPGAAGVVATAALVQFAPDGYTLGAMDSGPLAIAPALNSKVAYQTLKDLTFITALAAVPTILVVNSSVPANTLQEFIKLAKSKPGELNFGSAGNGSIHHLTMEMFMQDAGIKLVHVPYKGGRQSSQAYCPAKFKPVLLEFRLFANWSSRDACVPWESAYQAGRGLCPMC